jgi:hypothetical protein
VAVGQAAQRPPGCPGGIADLARAEPGAYPDAGARAELEELGTQVIGAVTIRSRIWLTAWVQAFIAERRATRSVRIASTGPSPPLGRPDASPFSAAPAAASVSVVSDLPLRRRACPFGRFTSVTSTPCPVR